MSAATAASARMTRKMKHQDSQRKLKRKDAVAAVDAVAVAIETTSKATLLPV